jgi:hypothetical protein
MKMQRTERVRARQREAAPRMAFAVPDLGYGDRSVFSIQERGSACGRVARLWGRLFGGAARRYSFAEAAWLPSGDGGA